MEEKNTTHWTRTRRLMLTTLAIWFVFGYILPWFGGALNNLSFLGFPLGFYMAAQGSLIAFVVLLFWFARAQDKIDTDCDVHEFDNADDGDSADSDNGKAAAAATAAATTAASSDGTNAN